MRDEGAHRIAGIVCLALAFLFAVPTATADDRAIAELSKQLSSSSDKVRLSAVTALARIGEKSTLKPLVAALGDPNAEVRGVAAIGLGRLGHKAALPALRTMASEDTDAAVRNSAKQAAIAIAKANNLPDQVTPAAEAQPTIKANGGTAGFGNQPRAIENRPEVFVAVHSANDDSPGKADKATRQVHADIVKQVLADHCRRAPSVTSDSAVAKRYGLDPRNIDVSVIKLETSMVTTPRGEQMVQMTADLRIAISDGKGRMLSFLSGGAQVQLPKATFDPKHLPKMRRDALENAMRGMFDKLIAHLRSKSTT